MKESLCHKLRGTRLLANKLPLESNGRVLPNDSITYSRAKMMMQIIITRLQLLKGRISTISSQKDAKAFQLWIELTHIVQRELLNSGPEIVLQSPPCPSLNSGITCFRITKMCPKAPCIEFRKMSVPSSPSFLKSILCTREQLVTSI